MAVFIGSKRRLRPYTWILCATLIFAYCFGIIDGIQSDSFGGFDDDGIIDQKPEIQEKDTFSVSISQARIKRQAPPEILVPPWIRELTAAEKKSIKSGWQGHEAACDPDHDAEVRDYFLNNPNTTETVETLLGFSSKDKNDVCDFLSKYLWCSRLVKKCICRLGAAHVDGECRILEGAYDCGNKYYDTAFIDDPKKDNRAGLLAPVNCVPNTKCEIYPGIGEKTEKIFVCKPDTPGNFPNLKKVMQGYLEQARKKFPWIETGQECKIHLNMHSDVTNHTEQKEINFREYSALARHSAKKCNFLKNEECHRVARVCVCAKGFVREKGECRLSGSTTLFEDHIRKCEFEIWPTFIVSEKLLEIEKYEPDKVSITCVTNAACKPNPVCATDAKSPDCYKTCQCEPGKVCAIPKPYIYNNTAAAFPFPSLFLPLVIPSILFQ